MPTVVPHRPRRVPYIDRAKEGQGVWFGTPNAVRITVFSGIFAFVGTMLLILFDAGKHAQIYENDHRYEPGPSADARPDWLPDVGFINAVWDLAFSRNLRAIQTEWTWKTDLGGLVPMLQPATATTAI